MTVPFSIGRTAHGLLVVDDGRARPLPHLVPDAPGTVEALPLDWDGWCDRIAATVAADTESDAWAPAAGKQWVVPVAPPTIYACGANFYDHVAEMGARVPEKSVDRVFHFTVPPAALTAHGAPVRRPAGCVRLDHEVELAGSCRIRKPSVSG